jgi:hypothetical protein
VAQDCLSRTFFCSGPPVVSSVKTTIRTYLKVRSLALGGERFGWDCRVACLGFEWRLI